MARVMARVRVRVRVSVRVRALLRLLCDLEPDERVGEDCRHRLREGTML